MASSALSGDALAALLKSHAAARDQRAKSLAKCLSDALVVAEEVQNNCRAALGMELNSCASNQLHLEHAVKQLRSQVAALTRQGAAYTRAYAALARAASDLPPTGAFLSAMHASLTRSNENLEQVASRLA